MKSLIRKATIIAISLAALIGIFAGPAMALDCTKDVNATACAIQGGVKSAAGEADQSKAGDNINNTLTNVVNIFSLVIGIIAVIVIIIAGLTYITSGGDAGKTASAKNTILYAVIGLIVVAFAQVIVRFAVNAGTGSVVNPSSGTCSNPVTDSNPNGDPNCKCSSQGCVETFLDNRHYLQITKLSSSLTA